MGKDYGKFVAEAPSREALSDWVAKYFAGKDLDEVQSMIAVMTDADLAAFHDRAVRDTGKYYSKLADGYFDLAIYACQESVPWNSREDYEEIKKTYRFPWVDDGEVVAFYDLCDSFPHHDRPGLSRSGHE